MTVMVEERRVENGSAPVVAPRPSTPTPFRVFIGYDGREPFGYEVTLRSLRRHSSIEIDARPLLAAHLRAMGLYWRPEARREGVRWDLISDAPMSTEFALTRFLVPALCDFDGWALFCDCDFMFREDIAELIALADTRYAVMVVQHDHRPASLMKMDGQPQTVYPRKNWSSLMLWNCGHPANLMLDLDDVNTVPGLKLHSFWWLADGLIGSLPPEWNYLVTRHSSLVTAPKAIHFTEGTPDMPDYVDQPFAEEWRAYLRTGNEPKREPGMRVANE